MQGHTDVMTCLDIYNGYRVCVHKLAIRIHTRRLYNRIFRRITNTFAKIRRRSRTAEHDTEIRPGSYTPCRIWIPQSHPTPGATTHAGYYGLFSLFTPVSGLYHARSPEPGDRSPVGDDRPRDDAGSRAMGRHRGELSDDPTVLYDQYQLGHTPMGADSPPSVGA